MNPNLLYAQAISGRFTGRGIGIIDTLHLVEVARAIPFIDESGALAPAERQAVRSWFDQYLTWMTTHPYGEAERDAKNNHGTCWNLQVAEFARYTDRSDLTAFCRERFKTVLVPGQIAPDGSFPGRAPPHEAVRLFALQPRCDDRHLPGSVDERR